MQDLLWLAVLAGLVGVAWANRDRFLPVEVGTIAPDFPATDMAGRPVTLKELRGQVVLLNIWATWCAPCREEMPSLERLHRELADDGLRIVAVSVDGPGAAQGIRDFARDMGLTFEMLHDPDQRPVVLVRARQRDRAEQGLGIRMAHPPEYIRNRPGLHGFA